MKEELIREQVLSKAGDLSREEALIKELELEQSPEYTIQTQILTIFCC